MSLTDTAAAAVDAAFSVFADIRETVTITSRGENADWNISADTAMSSTTSQVVDVLVSGVTASEIWGALVSGGESIQSSDVKIYAKTGLSVRTNDTCTRADGSAWVIVTVSSIPTEKLITMLIRSQGG